MAVIPRFAYLNENKNTPFFRTPIIDAKAYDELARQIASGSWIGEESFWQPPLYSYFLAIQYFLFGRNLFFIRIIQHILGAGTCLIVFLLTQKLFNGRAAYIAVLLMMFNGVLIYYEGELLITALFIFFVYTWIYYLSIYEESGGARGLVPAGIFYGLSSLARPNILVICPFLLYWFYRLPISKRFRDGFLFFVVVLLLIFPVTLRNYLVSGDFVLISYNGGINFYLGNNADYEDTVGIRPGLEWDRLLGEARKQGFTRNSQYSSYWYSRGLEYPLKDPFGYTLLLGKKLWLLFHGHEIMRNLDYNYFRKYSGLLKLPLPNFYLLGPLGLLGWGICCRGNRRTLILSLFGMGYLVSVLLFFVTSRYRAPLIPLFCIFSGCWIDYIIRTLSSASYRVPIIHGVILTVLLVVLAPDYMRVNTIDRAEALLQTGQSYLLKKEYETALDYFRNSLQVKPEYPDTFFNLGQVYQETGRYDVAVQWFQKILKWYPNDPKTHNNLGLCYMELEQNEKALQHFQKAYEEDPRIIETLNNLGNFYARTGNYKNAAEIYGEALALNPELAVIRKNMGEMYMEMQETNKAINEFTRVTTIEPDRYEGYYALAKAYMVTKEFHKAAKNLEKALQLNPGLVSAHGYLGQIYSMDSSSYRKALYHWKTYLNMDPDNPEKSKILREIERLHYLSRPANF